MFQKDSGHRWGSSFFIFHKNLMVFLFIKKTSPLWGSISLLIGVVIAILALVRGFWQLPLLLLVFAVWGLWLIGTQLLPAWRMNRSYHMKERRLQEQQVAEIPVTPGQPGTDVSRKLLNNVSLRITERLKAAYPNARWEWTMADPIRFVEEGGTGRIRVYGIKDFDYVDVELDQKANLKCSLIKIIPVTPDGADGQAAPPNKQVLDPKVWYELRGRKTLETLVTDLNSRGHNSLTLRDDGSICIQPDEGSGEVVMDTLLDFPEKVYWPMLVKVLAQEGLAADIQDTALQVSW